MTACLSVILALALHEPVDTTADPAICRCAAAEAADGWCAKCKVGYYATQRIPSAKMFTMLDLRGHEVDAAKTTCTECRGAIQAGGFCDACKMGYVDGRGYFARVCYHLAKGRMLDAAPARAPCCPVDGGWCDTCKRGTVGNREFRDQRDLTDARRFVDVLKSAVRALRRCESCAMAMVADAHCLVCRVAYKDGEPVAQPAERKPAAGEPQRGSHAGSPASPDGG